MTLRDPRLLLVAALLGAGIAAVVFLGQGDDAPRTEVPLLGETDEGEVADPGDVALRGAAAAAPAQAPADAENPFRDERDLRTLLVATLNWKTSRHGWERLEELLRADPERIPELLALLRPGSTAQDFYVARQCNQIGELLARIGRPGLMALLEALQDDDPHYLVRIAACIGPFGPRAAIAVPKLVDLMHNVDEEPAAKMTAVYVDVLGRIGPDAKEILPTLHRWLDEGETAEVEVAAARALVRIGGPTKDVFRRAIDVISVSSWQQQRRAMAEEIGALGRKAAGMLPELIELAHNGEDAAVQGMAVNLIGMIGVPDPDAIAMLEKDLTDSTNLDAFTGPWAFALSKLGPAGRAALLRAVEAHAPLSAGYAARHLRTSGIADARIWSMLEPGVVLGRPEDDRVKMLSALDRFFASECKVPHPAAVRLLPTFIAFPDDGHVRLRALSFAYYVDKHAPAWLAMMQDVLRNERIEDHLRVRIAQILIRSAAADRARTLDGVRTLIEQHASSQGVYDLLIPFVQSHPHPVLTTWRQGVQSGAVDWDRLRRFLTKGKPPKLVAPPSVVQAIREGTSGG